jgi:uncharacterized protein YebE (UPF0316 family)
MSAFVSSLLAKSLVLPFLVFLAELCVVTLFTLRIIFISRGMKILAPIVGFFEVTIWLFAIAQVMQNLQDPRSFLAFAGGFTLGNLLGMLIEKRLALGKVVIRTITIKDVSPLVNEFWEATYGVTVIDGAGARGPVKVVLTVVPRKELDAVIAIIRRFDPGAFYSVDDLQEVAQGTFPQRRSLRGLTPSLLQPFRRAA